MTSSKPEPRRGESRVDKSTLYISLSAAALPGLYLLLTSTTSPFTGIWPYDAKRILQFLLLLVLLALPLVNRRIRHELGACWSAAPGWLAAALIGTAAWGVLSALTNARSPMHAFNSLADVALLASLVLGVVVVAACRRIAGAAFDRTAVSLLVLTGLVVGLQEILGVLAALASGLDFNFQIALLHFSFPRFYNQVQSWIIPVRVALPLLFSRYRLATVMCLSALGLQWFIVLMTGARGSFVSLALAFAFAAVVLPGAGRTIFKWQASGLAIGILLFAAVMFAFEYQLAESDPAADVARTPTPALREADRPAEGSQIGGGESSFFRQSVGRPMAHTSGRTWMWSIAIADVRRHPWLGMGPMGYACVSGEGFGHPHNFALQMAAEWGLPAALLTAVLCFALLWIVTARLRSSGADPEPDGIVTGLLLTGVLAAALHAGLSGVMVMPASQVAGLLVTGMLIGRLPYREPSLKPVRAAAVTLIGPALMLFLISFGGHELKYMEERSARLPERFSLYPRLWQNSKICLLHANPAAVEN